MRKILFRAVAKGDLKTMVHGYYHYDSQTDNHYICLKDSLIRKEIDPDTLGQFTGLTDKNGKEIWEGDIVKCHYFYEALGENLGVYEAEKEIVGEIWFQEMGLWIESNNEFDSGYLLWINGLHEESFEIIGTIHENPELL